MQALAAKEGAIVSLIAETGGRNAMIVDSTALPEQVAFEIKAITEMREEIFDPVLHLVRQINALGYGLTLGVQTRIDSRWPACRASALARPAAWAPLRAAPGLRAPAPAARRACSRRCA